MIADKEHAELRNLMTPLVNYFSLIERYNSIKDNDKISVIKELLEKEEKMVCSNLPKIREILDADDKKIDERSFCDCKETTYSMYDDVCITCGRFKR